MNKFFNITGDCKPKLHYMANIRPKLVKIKEMIDRGDYFTINRARQYGKTTTLRSLSSFLEKEYLIISLDFQLFSSASFSSEQSFTAAFSSELLSRVSDIPIEAENNTALYRHMFSRAFFRQRPHNADISRYQKQISKDPCHRTCKTYAQVPDRRYKKCADHCPCHHLTYTCDNCQLAVAKALYRKAHDIYQRQRHKKCTVYD